ncbi:MAG: proton-conducting transporter membrane subunit [Bacteroidales bacterium]|nr:proton-conducting transporter membrane subunit [Bacteroidales bacterium]
MNLAIAFLLVPLAGTLLIPFLKVNGKGIAAFSLLFVNALISGYLAVQSLQGDAISFNFPGSYVTGTIPIRIDALSGWFMLIINLVFVTGGFYGLFYMKAYKWQANNLTLHSISLLFQHAAIVSVCVIQNSLVFLIAWEMLALASFLLIIFEHEHIATLKAGINYLIQAHFSIIFLMIGFIWVSSKTGSYDFAAITAYSASIPATASFMLFILFFIAFAIKAGFVPFHTWLPYAHPAAPSHVSGMMSGVIIKIGIFGIFRMLLVVKTDFTSVGYLILIVSLISGLYGVMLAIIQHNLKKLLAYHSIENIGIIGIGIGIGCIGIGTGNQVLSTLGFAGALLHTLNHSLFKSLLFYAAGNIYQATHTMDVEKLGGLIKKMPQTAALFLIAAIAICGIPPFNGFVSEFIMYTGLYNWLSDASLLPLLAAIFSTAGLALIGGLAMLCFTKAFGVVFLGSARSELPHSCKEVPFLQLLPMYLLAVVIVLIGLFPMNFINLLSQPVSLFTGSVSLDLNPAQVNAFNAIQPISLASWILILLILSVFIIRRLVMRRHKISTGPTWGCGYVAPTPKIQYTAGSFVRTYSKLFAPFLLIGKHEEEIHGVFPSEGKYHTHPYDEIEKLLIDSPLKLNKSFMGRFLFLNNGKLQFYILYGVLFILAVISLPVISRSIYSFIEFLKQL